jgi:hypothetical protein
MAETHSSSVVNTAEVGDNRHVQEPHELLRPVSRPVLMSGNFLQHAVQNGGIPYQSQVPFHASNSDDLFHPISGRPSSIPYVLPDVPLPQNPRLQHAYIQPLDTFHRNRTFQRDIPPHMRPNSPNLLPSVSLPQPYIPINQPYIPNDQSHYPIPHQHPPLPFMQPSFATAPPPFISHVPPNVPHYSPPFAHPYPPPSFPNPPIQYVYCLPPPNSQASPFSQSKTLPSVTHISILTSKSDFYAWDEGVTSLLQHLGLLGHILDPGKPLDHSRPDRVPVPEPVLTAMPTPQELAASKRWWEDDNVAQHVLMARLGSTLRGLVPSSSIANRSARTIYSTLTQYFGLSSFADGSELHRSLNDSTCTAGRVQEYVSKWRVGVARLSSALMYCLRSDS